MAVISFSLVNYSRTWELREVVTPFWVLTVRTHGDSHNHGMMGVIYRQGMGLLEVCSK